MAAGGGSSYSSNSARGSPLWPDDGEEGPDVEFPVIRDGDGGRAGLGAALHGDVAPAAADLGEALRLEDPAGLPSREDAEPTQRSLRTG